MVSGVPIIRANNNRVQGWLQVKEYLMTGEDGKPSLTIFNTCRGLIGDLEAIQADETNPNDCAKQPHDVTHSPDMLRYFCISRTLPGEKEVEGVVYDEFEDTDAEDELTGGEVSAEYINA